MLSLPISHRIIEYFPFLKNENKSTEKLYNEFNNTYENIKDELKPFYKINCKDHMNWRYPLTTAYFIKDELNGKIFTHIGCKKQELDVGFIKYAKKIIGIEISNVDLRKDLKKQNYELIINDYKNVIKNINSDIYYFWTGYKSDIHILNDLIINYKKKGIFYLGVPQQDDKLCDFLKELKLWYEKNRYVNIDYVPILFDESHIPIKSKTLFTDHNKFEQWNDKWKTFNNMRGILFLIKISL
tara:strand:- start:46 stop:768 length:723 start_codon:yes stop_codon:yes gene_type:complete